MNPAIPNDLSDVLGVANYQSIANAITEVVAAVENIVSETNESYTVLAFSPEIVGFREELRKLGLPKILQANVLKPSDIVAMRSGLFLLRSGPFFPRPVHAYLVIPLYKEGNLSIYANDFKGMNEQISSDPKSATLVPGQCKLESYGDGKCAMTVVAFETAEQRGVGKERKTDGMDNLVLEKT
ncbi:hypothetical protein LOZ58_006883 [Ophidiomyces ophidiicola]|nr:hypothetical protein LOZ58_006883 [Ophidiomyces ophidiicola]